MGGWVGGVSLTLIVYFFQYAVVDLVLRLPLSDNITKQIPPEVGRGPNIENILAHLVSSQRNGWHSFLLWRAIFFNFVFMSKLKNLTTEIKKRRFHLN